jgi:hypothetical protein
VNLAKQARPTRHFLIAGGLAFPAVPERNAAAAHFLLSVAGALLLRSNCGAADGLPAGTAIYSS